MPVSEAKKKANARWNASKDNIMIRPEKEAGAAIRAAALAAGQSNQQYILQATQERMERDSNGRTDAPAEIPQDGAGDVSGVGGGILTPAALETATGAAQKTGETVSAFVERAVTVQAQRDKASLRMGINPAKPKDGWRRRRALSGKGSI